MTVNRRNKQYIDDCLSEVQTHSPAEAEAIRGYIKHLEACIEAWQKQSGEKHPTLEDF